jgi:hypothetical protein
VPPEPFIEAPRAEEPPTLLRLWLSVALLTAGVVMIIAVAAYCGPMVGEGFFVHEPAKATVQGRDVRVLHDQEGQWTETYYLVTWTDDRGRAQKGKLQTVWRSFAPGDELEVRYVLKPDGKASDVWPADPDLIWIGPLVSFLAAAATLILLFAQTLGAAVKASRRPAPTPDSGPNP